MIEKYTTKQEKESGILTNLNDQLLLANELRDVYKNRPEIDSFVNLNQGDTNSKYDYSEAAITKDKLYVQQTRERIDQENSSTGKANLDHIEGGFQLSEMLQVMVIDCINKHWFKDCKTIMTSDFDDLFTGIDAVVRHEKGNLGLAIDFTVTNQDKKIYEKLQKVWERSIKGGRIPTIKYFEDPVTKEKKSLLVPKFIIGASKKDVEEFANAYIGKNKESLVNHPFKYLMLMQIEEQLQTVLDHYEVNSENQSLQFAKLQYEKIQRVLRNMKNEIHADEKMHKNTDIHEYAKKSIALDMMRRFRIMREQDSK